jgi:hypothetical protein
VTDERKAFEAEIINWLIGISDHTDNEVEHDLLGCLIESIRDGEYIEEPVVIDPNWKPPAPDANCPF